MKKLAPLRGIVVRLYYGNRLHKFPPFFNRSISDKTADIMSGEAFIEVNCFSSVSKTINFSWIGSILFKLGYIRWKPGPGGKTLLYINRIFKTHGGHHCKPQNYVTHDTLVSLLYNHFSIVIWFFVDFGSKTMLSNVVKITIIGLIGRAAILFNHFIAPISHLIN